MASKILIGIALDGDSEVKRKLQEVGEAGKRSLENIGNKLNGGGGKNTALADLQKQATGLRGALAPLAEASGVGGLLSGAGLGGILARFAAGPGGILAGLSGAALGLAKIGESSDRAKGRLAGLGDAKGFDNLSERAKALGTDVAGLQPRYERFLALQQKVNADNTSIIHPPGFQPGAIEETAGGVRTFSGGKEITPPSRENFGKFDSALLTQIRRDVKSGDDAKAIADQFQQTLATSGLTPEALRGLQQSSPSAANFITQQLSKKLGQGFENPNVLATALEQGRVQPLDAAKVINAGAQPNEELAKAATAARGVTQAFEGLTAAGGNLLEKLGGDKVGLTPGIDKATGLVNQGSALLDQMAKNRTETGPTSLGEVFSSGKGDLLGRITGYIRNQLTESAPKSGEVNPFSQIMSGMTDALKQLFSGDYFNKSSLPVRPDYTPRGELPAPAPVSAAAPEAPIDYTDGRRYSRTLNPTPVADEVSDAGRGLAAAITEAANAIRNATSGNTTQTVPGRAGGGGIDITGGGHIRGPGTTTSDSIPVAKVSDEEYVIKAASARKAGLAHLDWINAGMPGHAGGGPIRLADGGSPSGASTDLSSGAFNVEATDDGGAIINGVKYGPGAPILAIPAIAQALARSRAQKQQDSGRRKHKSDFVGIFGGHVFDTPGSYAKGGAIGRLPHFASGGIMPDFSAGAAPSLSDNLAAPGGGSLGHMDVNLSTNYGDFKMRATPDVARAMAAAARDAADVQTGPRPSWFRGRG